MNQKKFSELSLQGVGVNFAGFHALRDFNLTVRAGEFISLLGPSGCGKSTALNCLSGLLALSSGKIMLDATRVDVLPPEQRGFGMVFQNYALFPHLSVRRNVAFGLEMRRRPPVEIERKVEEALATVRLTSQIDKLPGNLSGGQQQRVAIARAVAIEPPLVLMDEPLSNLDTKLRLELRHEIKRLHGVLGLTTIYVTHDQDEALSLSDRIVVMRDGHIQQVGTPEDLYAHPISLYVARFMGYRNAFSASVASIDASPRITSGCGLDFPMELSPGVEPQCLAFRAEDVEICDSGIQAEVAQVEYCGQYWQASLQLRSGETVACDTGHRLRQGETIHFLVPGNRIRFFAEPYAGEST